MSDRCAWRKGYRWAEQSVVRNGRSFAELLVQDGAETGSLQEKRMREGYCTFLQMRDDAFEAMTHP